MNAYAIIHFGENIKYIELEIYFILNLRKYTKNDILYFYSINDTPKKYLKIFEKICTKVIPYDDKDITYNIKFSSSYKRNFNPLRTCNFIFAYKLEQYKKICIMESDIIVNRKCDDVFKLNAPAILVFLGEEIPHKMLSNMEISHLKDNLLKNCDEKSITNGGVMLIEPSINTFNILKSNIKLVVDNNCKFPNEVLFMLSHRKIYQLPVIYNFIHFKLKVDKWRSILEDGKVTFLHFCTTDYRAIDIYKENYLGKINNKFKKKMLLKLFKIYKKWVRIIDKLLY